MATLQKEVKRPQEATMRGIILADSVYTPTRAHLRWGYEGACGVCGAEQGHWLDYVHKCTQTPKMQGQGKMPDCLKYTGNITAGWIHTPDSRDI